MNIYNDYSGTLQHQALQRAIVAFYEDDPRILAVSVFGSLSRGNWDHYSDIDLDIVIADNIHINVVQELKLLCDSFTDIDEHGAVIVPNGDDAGDIVFES